MNKTGRLIKMRDLAKILSVFPDRLKIPLGNFLGGFSGNVYELRLIKEHCVFAVTNIGLRFISGQGGYSLNVPLTPLICTGAELDEITDRATCYSGFSNEDKLKNGFAVYADGCRIGIVTENNSAKGCFGRVCSLNIRLPVWFDTEYANPVLYDILPGIKRGLLIAGRPASGKTTMLRSCIRILAGGKTGVYKKVCVIDERGELSGNGIFLGECADVIANCKKHDAMEKALRLMSPDVMVCDEIGSAEETDVISDCLNSGVCFIASIHAADVDELIRRRQFIKLSRENVFDEVIFLSEDTPGKISEIITAREITDEICRNNAYMLGSYNERHGFLSTQKEYDTAL